MQLDHVEPTAIGGGTLIGSVEKQVINPPLPNGTSHAEPLDLGDLPLTAP